CEALHGPEVVHVALRVALHLDRAAREDSVSPALDDDVAPYRSGRRQAGDDLLDFRKGARLGDEAAIIGVESERGYRRFDNDLGAGLVPPLGRHHAQSQLHAAPVTRAAHLRRVALGWRGTLDLALLVVSDPL